MEAQQEDSHRLSLRKSWVRGPARGLAVPGGVWLALFAVYVIWGSTYLAQRVALRGFPPFLMGGVRFTLAGAVLFIVLRARGAKSPTREQWLASAKVGALLMVGGNGLVAYAQQFIASGIAAVVVATMPLWAVLFASFLGSVPSRAELVGITLGFAGVALLKGGGSFDAPLLAVLAMLIAPMSWALGSVWSRRLPLPKGAMASAAQMLWGGLFMTMVGMARGERIHSLLPEHVAAFFYLVVFGSLIAFRAYGYLLEHTRPAVATSYAFVNPAIAVGLGVLFAQEELGMTGVIACGLTVAGVVVVLLGRRHSP